MDAQTRQPYRIFISTGEVSGDLQGALLIQALQRQGESLEIPLEIKALGGEQMAKAGADLLADTTGIGAVGLWESLPYFWSTIQLQRQTQAYLRRHPPDVMVLIDYMGPNLGIGSFMKEELPQVPVVYYIAPQEWVWSWGQQNTVNIVRFTDLLLAIFPGEAQYFRDKGAQVEWVGHPLIDRMETAPSRTVAREALGLRADEVMIALVPASRRQELRHLLPVMLQAADQLHRRFPQAHFYLPLSQEAYRQPIEAAIAGAGVPVTITVPDPPALHETSQTLTVLAAADLAITKSGTVNLEIALLGVPQVVIYRVGAITAWIARHLLKFSIPFMSPPNLVLMRQIVPELLQDEVSVERIVAESLDFLLDRRRREQLNADYQEMRQALGTIGVCDRAALKILQFK